MRSSIAVGLFFIGCLYVANALPLGIDGLDSSVDPVEWKTVYELSQKMYADLEWLSTRVSEEQEKSIRKTLATIIWSKHEEFDANGVKLPYHFETLKIIQNMPLKEFLVLTRSVHFELMNKIKGDELVQLHKELLKAAETFETYTIKRNRKYKILKIVTASSNETQSLREVLATTYKKIGKLNAHVWNAKKEELIHFLIEFIKRADEKAQKLNTVHKEWEQSEAQVAIEDLDKLTVGELVNQASLRVRNVMTTYWDTKRQQTRQYIKQLFQYFDEQIAKFE